MSKKKKQKAPKGLGMPTQPKVNILNGKPPTAEEIENRQLVVQRLSKAFKALSAPPEPILTMFDRLGLKYVVDTMAGELEGQYVLIKYEDLVAAEEANQKHGSIVQRLYPVEPQPDLPANTHNPETGEALPEPVAYQPDPDEYEFDLGKVQG